jgi:hypothetical protein
VAWFMRFLIQVIAEIVYKQEFLLKSKQGSCTWMVVFCLGTIFISLSATLYCRADSLGLTPTISINGGYDDNILFSRTEPVTDSYLGAIPEIDLSLASELYKVNLISRSEIVRYLEEKDLDYESYHHKLGAEYLFSPVWTYSGVFAYKQDTTLQSELEESGRVVSREERVLMQADNSLVYSHSKLSEIEIEYQYRSIEYESDERVDHISHRIQLPFQRWFNNYLDRVTLRPSYKRTETEDGGSIDYYNFTVGWLHEFSPTMQLKNFVGYGYAQTTRDNDQDFTQGGNFDLSLTLNDEIYSVRIGLRSNLNVDTEGDLREVDRFYCRIRKKITERLSTGINGSVYINRSPENYDLVDTVFYNLRPELSYEITENHYLKAFYRYSLEEDQTVSDNRYSTRNVIEFNIVGKFPMRK